MSYLVIISNMRVCRVAGASTENHSFYYSIVIICINIIIMYVMGSYKLVMFYTMDYKSDLA